METTPTSPQRPQGITAIALLLFFAAALMILFVFTLAVTQEPLPNMPELADSGVSLEELRPIFTAALLILGAVFIAAGTGLWQLRNWGRILALVLAGLEVFGQILRVLGAAASASDFSLVTSLLFLGLYGWIFWYLIQPGTKQAFQALPSAQPPQDAPPPQPPPSDTPPPPESGHQP